MTIDFKLCNPELDNDCIRAQVLFLTAILTRTGGRELTHRCSRARHYWRIYLSYSYDCRMEARASLASRLQGRAIPTSTWDLLLEWRFRCSICTVVWASCRDVQADDAMCITSEETGTLTGPWSIAVLRIERTLPEQFPGAIDRRYMSICLEYKNGSFARLSW